MAIKGLSKPIFGQYTNTAGTISYTNGVSGGHAISWNLSIDASDDNPLYADNVVVEHDNGAAFGSGTLTLNTDELSDTLAKFLLNLNKVTEGTSPSTIDVYNYDDSAVPITVGFGIIELHQVSDTDKYRAVMLHRCVPKFPANAATTKGESIDWQTREIEFSVERSEAAAHPWMSEAWFTSETAALTWLNGKLGVANQG